MKALDRGPKQRVEQGQCAVADLQEPGIAFAHPSCRGHGAIEIGRDRLKLRKQAATCSGQLDPGCQPLEQGECRVPARSQRRFANRRPSDVQSLAGSTKVLHLGRGNDVMSVPDCRTAIAAVKIAREIAAAPPLADVIGEETLPGPA